MRETQSHEIPKSRLLSWRVFCLTGLALSVMAPPVRAQVRPDDPRHAMSTREELEALAVQAEQIANSSATSDVLRARKRAEAEALRERLRDGDFRVGDRIVVGVRGDTAMTDTFVVRGSQQLELPNIPPISLQGVLRSELNQTLFREVGRYLKNPQVTSGTLIRIGVLGQVTKPGFYSVPADMLVTDVIMAYGGGPAATADLDATEFKRGSAVVWGKEDMRVAIREGSTLDQLSIRAGDALVIGEKKKKDFVSLVQPISIILGLVVSVYGLSRLRR